MIIPENNDVSPIEEKPAEGNSSNNNNNSMDVEKPALPPSGRYTLNNEETKVASVAAVSEAEGSSESGDDLFPTANTQEAADSFLWTSSTNPQEEEEATVTPIVDASTTVPPLPALPSTDIVPFDSAKASLSDFYANRPTNEAPVTPPPDEQPDTTAAAAATTTTIRTKRKRATGLGNLGNTCFMNSTLQCLAHTSPLREYFISGAFKKDLNKDNPLGTGGELACEFAALLVQMWCLEHTSTTSTTAYEPLTCVTYPRSFKQTLGKYAQQFIGYDQHDSQELAIYLLDALHEDTNRITKKPYIEKPEQALDESDEVAANKAWGVHLQREDSKVFDYFMGQIKSRLQCTTVGCGRVSTTFDPSMYLSVPIPGSTDREMKVTFVPLDKSLGCAELTVKLCKNSTITGLKKHVADLARECFGFKEDELLEEDVQLADIFSEKVYEYLPEESHIDKIRDSDETFAYQLYPLAKVKEEFGDFMEKKKKEASKAKENAEEVPDFLLDSESRAQLDNEEEWQKSLERYIPNAHMSLARHLNEKRSNYQDRMDYHDKIMRFVSKCRKCSDCKLPDDVIMEEKSDKVEPHVNNPEAEDGQTLADVCDINTSFHNITNARDVAILEYCAYKFKTFINKIEEKVPEFNENGYIVDVALNKDGKRVGKPIVVRIPSTLTVSQLRDTLADQLSPILKVDSTASATDAIGGMSPQSSLMMQMALSHETRSKTYSSSSITSAFGSVTKQHFADGTPSFAKPSEDEEKGLIAEFVSHQESTITLTIPSRLNDYINEDALSIAESWLSETQKIEKEKLQDNKVSVLDCIAKFCQAEQLDENDMWYCNKCKQHNQAWKECHLYRTPPILVIHLKRFHYSASTHRRDKIDTFIDFPLNDLDLRETVTYWKEGEEPIYDCYAVSNHFGGLGGGHYTAYARGDDGSWSNFDDSRVTPGVSESEVVSNAAYCLYYKRKDVVFNESKEIEDVVVAQEITSDNGMDLGSPECKPSVLSDDASSQAQMDVDDRSAGNLSMGSTGFVGENTWGDDNMNDDNGIPQLIASDQDYNYPLQ